MVTPIQSPMPAARKASLTTELTSEHFGQRTLEIYRIALGWTPTSEEVAANSAFLADQAAS